MGKKQKTTLFDLEVKKVKVPNAKSHPPVAHPVLPQHEFSMLIVAPKGSGKTNFICNLLLHHYKGYFNRVLVCSPTIDNDDKWDVIKTTKHILKENTQLEEAISQLKDVTDLPKIVFRSGETEHQTTEDQKYTGLIPEEDFFSRLDELPGRIAEQQELIAKLREKGFGTASKFLADRMLVILDDQAGMFSNSAFGNPISNYVIKHRHSNSSVIVVTQAYKAVPKMIRVNCNVLIAFEIANEAELQSLYEEWPCSMKQDQWDQVFKYCTEELFTFMYINLHFPRADRIYKTFQYKIKYYQSGDDDDEPGLASPSSKTDSCATKRAEQTEPSNGQAVRKRHRN